MLFSTVCQPNHLWALPGKALRTPVDIARLADPGKVDIKICEPGILFISVQATSDDAIIDFCVDSMSLTT